MKKFYITTPLYYVNASPHVGHAYTNVIADCTARFRRLKGEEVFFLTGTDEHGIKIDKAAQAAGEEPAEFVDRIVGNFKTLWEKLNISYDFFIRTTLPFHKSAVREAIVRIADNKNGESDIYKKKYQGYYCTPCESFWTASQVKEADGCPDCRRPVELIEEEDYFFRLSKYQQWLIGYLKENPDFVKPPARYNEVLSFLEKNELEDLCISRPKKRLSWGIDFPLDDNYVVYVWFDALLNYITAAGFAADEKKFKSLWPADIHFMAKDILRQHAVFWPIMLKALKLPLPKAIFAHGWWKFGGEKMSKSLGNIVNPLDLIDRIGVDALRYFLLREVPLGTDGNFSWAAILTRTNSDLANDLGNLVYRTLNMAEKYLEGEVSPASFEVPEQFKTHLDVLEKEYSVLMGEAAFSTALEKIFKFINVMNKYIEDTKPWILWKEKKYPEIKNFLYALLESIRIICLYLYPVIPGTAESIYRQLGIDTKVFSLKEVAWGRHKTFLVQKGQPLFPRIDED